MADPLADAIDELEKEIKKENKEAEKAYAKSEEHSARKDKLFKAAEKALSDGDFELAKTATAEAKKQSDLQLEQLKKGNDIVGHILGKYTALHIMCKHAMGDDDKSKKEKKKG